MSVRAKFHLNSITINMFPKMKQVDGKWVKDGDVEQRTLNLTPVYANNDPQHENSKFWEATPSGSIQLGCVNQEAWKHFEIGKDYYVDFTPVE